MTFSLMQDNQFEYKHVAEANANITSSVNVLSFSERLAKQLEEAESKEIYNAQKNVYDWTTEANQKRSIR